MKRNLLFLLVLLLLSSAFAKVTAQVTITTPNGTDAVCGLNVLLTATAPPTAVRFEWTDIVSGTPIGGTTPMLMIIGSFAAPSIIQVEAFDGPAPGGLSLGTATITLTFFEEPRIGVPVDLELCDRQPGDPVAEQTDGLADFNLNQNLAVLLDGQDGTVFRVSYHTSMMDATDDVGEIPSARTSGGETIWARLDNNGFGASGPASDCFEIVSFDLIVNPNPIAITPPDMEACDGDNDQFVPFLQAAFTAQTLLITGGDPTLTVNYYLTASDADNAPLGLEIDLTLPSYTNVDPMVQTLHARVEDIATGCYDTVVFNLVVLPTPTPETMPLPYALCDTNADGVEIFDLTSREIEILNGLDPAIFDIIWYQDPMVAIDVSPIEPASDIADEVNYVSPTMAPLPATVQVYARVINTTQSITTRCFTVVELDLIVNPIPIPQPLMEPYALCDDAASGSTTDQISVFDLRSRDVLLTGGNASWAVSYYLTEPEAEAGVVGTELVDMYPNAVLASQTIWARVQDSSTGCFDTISVTLVVNPNPSPLAQAPVEQCDIDFALGDLVADGMGLFDLAQGGALVMAIENGESDVMTDFFETEANANANDPMTIIPSATLYSAMSGSIWARVNNTLTLCFTLLEVELVVNPSPEISDMLPELIECDADPTDAVLEAIFDLTLNEAAIYGAQAPADFNLTYHETQVSAEAIPGSAADAPIAMATLMNYTSLSGTIWVRLENVTTGCINVGSFIITVAPIPAYTAPDANFFACDNDDSGSDIDGITTFDLTDITTTIMASNPDLMVSYYVNLVDIPASPIPTPNAYQGTGADPQTIFIVIESTLAGMCSDQIQIDLRVNALPALISDPLPNAIACDPDNDGFGLFFLNDYAVNIINGQPGITVTFFELEQDALDNNTANAIDTSVGYNNISGMTTLYARAESVDNMPDNTLACAKVFPFDLEAHPVPLIPPAAVDLDIVNCDLDNSGDEIVDITLNEPDFLSIQDPAFTYIITYHITDMDAMTIGGPQIPTPGAYFMAVGVQTIFYRILNDDGAECFIVGSFELTLGALPVIVPPMVPLEVCDDDDDEVAFFDLTTIIDDLTLSNPLLNVDFYESQAVIDAGGAPIPDADEANYQNVANPQLVQVIVTTLEGCFIQTELTLRVLPLPTPDSISPADIVECDDDFDGFLTLDLTPTMNEIDASPSVVRRVFESQADADAYNVITNTPVPVAEDPAPFTYTNSIPNGQTIFVRIDHDPTAVPGNTCYVVVPVDIIINPLPIINPDIIDPYVFCEQEDGNDSEGILNLNIIASEIGLLAPPQQEGDFFITYHEQQSQAETGSFDLTSPYTFVERPAPLNGLWIRVENRVTGCFVLVFEEIIIEARPVANTPENLMECEIIVPDAANGIPVAGVGEFDLTVQNEVINGGPLAGDVEINYFISQAEALSNTNEIPNPDTFQNTSNPQTIWAVVENTTTTCPSSPPVFFEISVKATPYTDLSDTGGDICVDPVTGTIQNPVTLDATPETIVAGAIYTYAWTLDGALVSINPQVDVNAVGLYEVTVTATYTDILTGMITSCDYIANTLYTAISSPIFEVQVVEDSFNASGLYTVQVIEASIQGFGIADYEFAIDDGPFQTGLTFTNVRPGDHIVYGRRVDGECAATPVEIGIIDYPRFFTPNSDGFHDTWNILGLGSAPNLNAKIYIFDRYGKLLKQLSPVSRGWNGTYNGQPMPSSDYWFSVEYIEPGGENPLARKNFNGHFTLKR